MKAIILAGGGGTRLWPLSRESFPKQFIRLGEGPSLLQKTVQRLANIDFIDTIVVATNTKYLNLVKQHLDIIDAKEKIKILEEPHRKNTGPAISLAMQFIQTCCKASDSDSVLVLPSDHLMEPEAIFIQSLRQAEKIPEKRRMVTFGIRPTRAETGYGYIRIGKPYDAHSFEAEAFIEKPNLTQAKKYLEDPHYYWNSGMFLFSISLYWEELEKHCPNIFMNIHNSFDITRDHFHLMPDISIDYALMEKTKKILICPLAVSWSDIGSWDSLYEVMDKDAHQNVKMGQVLDIDTRNSLIIGGKRLISTIGLEDMLIIETDDAVFIAKKGESQKVKNLVQELANKGREEGLVSRSQVHPWGSIHLLDQKKTHTIRKIQLAPLQSMRYQSADCEKEIWIALQNGLFVDQKEFRAFEPWKGKEKNLHSISNRSNAFVELIIFTCKEGDEKPEDGHDRDIEKCTIGKSHK